MPPLLPPPTLLLVDWSATEAFVRVARAEFAAEIEAGSVRVFRADVRDIAPSRTAFVSPSNSLLFFDGGYDDALRRKFPGLQRRCQARLPELGFRTAIGRPYLPVGSALVSPTGPDTCVVASPTMFLPHDVSGTRNAYHALMAALMALDGFDADRSRFDAVVAPALCCGYGRMPHAESARQMREALRDFCAGARPPRDPSVCAGDTTLFVGPNRDDEQPINFDNREIKVINVADIRHERGGAPLKPQPTQP